MSASESDYQPQDDERESPSDIELPTTTTTTAARSRRSSLALSSRRPSVAPSSRRPSVAPSSPRKRRRSSSADPLLDNSKHIKPHLQGHYNDAYRTLFNEDVNSAAARFVPDVSIKLLTEQIGTSVWTPEEKLVFFAALERLGKDDTPGIASAIGTKSIPEVCQFSQLLHDAAAKHPHANVTLRDIPAATEVTKKCRDRLELAGDALAWYQERFEAKQEQNRYGRYWLITPEIADDIEHAQESLTRPAFSSSPPSHSSDEEDAQLMNENAAASQILHDIPEATLLNISNMLKLSSSVFMNGSSSPPSWYPHWSELISPLASKPSLYRTALVDLHTLVVSLTKRILQISIIEATSRIRAHGRPIKKRVDLVLKTKDVLTAIDVLRLSRHSRERWTGVARRCGLRVHDGTDRKYGRDMSWNEVEDALGLYEKLPGFSSTDDETRSFTSEPADEDFRSRAGRSGTPLPSGRLSHTTSEDEDESEQEHEDEISDAEGSHPDAASVLSPVSDTSLHNEVKTEEQTLEELDHEASREEERRLWNVLGVASPFPKANPLKLEDGLEGLGTQQSRKNTMGDANWRDWIEYRAEWEGHDTPAPLSMFQANKKLHSSAPSSPHHHSATDIGDRTEQSSSGEDFRSGRRSKRRRVQKAEIPTRGARAFAALQERISVSEDREAGERMSELDGDDDAEMPVRSIEDADVAMSEEWGGGD